MKTDFDYRVVEVGHNLRRLAEDKYRCGLPYRDAERKFKEEENRAQGFTREDEIVIQLDLAVVTTPKELEEVIKKWKAELLIQGS